MIEKDREIENLVKNIKEVTVKFSKLVSFLQSVTIGIGVMMVILIVILVKIIIGG